MKKRQWQVIGLAVVLLCTGGFSIASARTAVRIDARMLPFLALRACMVGKSCDYKGLFLGKLGEKTRRRLKRMSKRLRVLGVRLVRKLDKKYHARYRKRTIAKFRALSKAGYKTKELVQLGLGRSLASAGSHVSLIFAGVQIQSLRRPERKKTQYFFLVLWKVKTEWKIAKMDDFPMKWMMRNKPKAMGGKGLVPSNKIPIRR